MKMLFAFLGIIAVGLVVGFHQNSSIQEIRNANATLKSQAEIIPELESEIGRLESINIDTNALENLRGETVELMRLRAEASRLRPLVEMTDTELERELQQSESVLGKAETAFESEVNWIVETGNREVRTKVSSMLASKMNEYIEEQDRFPTSLELFRRDFSELLNSQGMLSRMNDSKLSPEDAERVSVRLEEFELLPPPEDYQTREERYLAFREKTPRQLHNGNWERNYGILETNPRIHNDRPLPFHIVTKTVKLEDDDFDRWERELAEANRSN